MWKLCSSSEAFLMSYVYRSPKAKAATIVKPFFYPKLENKALKAVIRSYFPTQFGADPKKLFTAVIYGFS